MATLTPTLDRPRTSSGGGNRGPIDRLPGGGSGGGRGDQGPNYSEQLRRYRLGMLVTLVAVFTLFLVCTVIFVLRLRGNWDIHTQSYIHNWIPITLPYRLLLTNTLIILISSFTLEKSRRQAFQQAALAGAAGIPGIRLHDDRTFPWLGLTVTLGLAFLVGQFAAWTEIMHRGFYLASNPNSSFFYMITGLHAIHLAAGLAALLYAAVFTRLRTHSLERRRITLEVTAWYWHSMAALWIYVFLLLKFVK
ncbi:MAG TPA: cytochrome c oxidase subunit 3 [Terriglobales bacterium]|nr:cytochrome c oxidase subunit 3 [Terriglobales bacterium]